MTKPRLRTYNLMVRLNLDIGFDIKASDWEDAIAKFKEMKVDDIVDFEANGWEHNDSKDPQLLSLYDSDAL